MKKFNFILCLSIIIVGSAAGQKLKISNDNIGAGIEVGSRGVKFSIIKVDKILHHFGFTYLKDGSINTQVIDFTSEAIEQTSRAVKAFYDTILQYNKGIIPQNKIFIAVSSGVKQEANKKPGTEELLRIAIKHAVPKYTKSIEFLDPCTEGDLTIKGVVPTHYLYTSSLVDIGSGNTKGGFRMKNTKVAECFNIPWGTSTLTKRLAKIPKDEAEKYFNDSINPFIVIEVIKKRGLTNSKHNYFSGGIYWAISNYLYPAKIKQDYTRLTPADIDNFLNAAKNNYDSLINPDLSAIKNEVQLAEAKKQIERTHTTFTQDNLIAGGLIVRSIFTEFEKWGMKDKRYVFSRFAYVGWISGYIVEKL